jgi:urease accessory protein
MNALAQGASMIASPTNLLAVVALGLFAGRQGRGPAPIVLFALGLLTGSLAIATALRDPPAAAALLQIAALAGVLVAVAWVPRLSGALAFAGGVALALNAPPQAITLSGAISSQVGAALAAILAFVAVALIAGAARGRWQEIGLRVVASWIAASAILALALRFAR